MKKMRKKREKKEEKSSKLHINIQVNNMYNLALSLSYYARIVNSLCGNCVNNHCMNFRQLRSFFYIGTICRNI